MLMCTTWKCSLLLYRAVATLSGRAGQKLSNLNAGVGTSAINLFRYTKEKLFSMHHLYSCVHKDDSSFSQVFKSHIRDNNNNYVIVLYFCVYSFYR